MLSEEKQKKAVAYLRVSTEMQVEGYSLAAQIESIERYAKAYDIEILKTYKDEGKSGKSIEGREDFICMLSDIETKAVAVDYVLVYKLSRFGRNAADVLATLQRLQDCGTNLICTEDRLDSSTGSGKLMIAVISAVAEIERVNILEHTMGGRKTKARDGKWNGGFAPYGYHIADDRLEIEDTEVEAIRVIYDKFITTDMGYNGIAKYLNRQGIVKMPRKNGTLKNWSAKMVKDVIDNPVYKGTIAYGRRIREKVKGTRADYKQVRNKEPILVHNAHKGIISVEDWEKAKEKRELTGFKSPSNVGRDRVHLLAGILRCPECGGPMYTNKTNAKRKNSAVEEVFYYVCAKNKSERGTSCSYSTSYRKDDIEPIVLNEIRNLVRNPLFAEHIKSKIGKEVDTTEIDKELSEYKKSLKLCESAKDGLEQDIDTMPLDEPHRERKLKDKNKRLNKQYDEIYELEEKIDDLIKKRRAVETNVLNLEQVYKILMSFDKIYDKMTDTEQKKVISYLIKEIEVYKKAKPRDGSKLKSITFTFPVSYDGEETERVLWDNESTVETCCLLNKVYSKQNK